jgi:hypothetical protein
VGGINLFEPGNYPIQGYGFGGTATVVLAYGFAASSVGNDGTEGMGSSC